MSDVKRNIFCLQIIKTCQWFLLIMPVLVLFYQSAGLSMYEILSIQAIYSISIVAWEIPTGYWADRLGRKKSIVWGCFFAFLGYLCYCFSHGFWNFAFAEIVLGLGSSLISGADTALLYDTLKANNQEELYLKKESRFSATGNFSEGIAGICGGLLAAIHLKLPFVFQTCILFLAIPAALSLKEPPVNLKHKKITIKELKRVVRENLWGESALIWSLLFSSFIGCATLTMAWFAQPLFKSVSLPITAFGIAWTILNLSVGLAAYWAWKLQEKWGWTATTLSFTSIICISFLLLALPLQWGGLFVLLLFYLARGLATPCLKNDVNKQTESQYRATILSIRSFFIRILFAIIGPSAGAIVDHYSLRSGFLFCGILFSILSIFAFIMVRRTSTNLQ